MMTMFAGRQGRHENLTAGISIRSSIAGVGRRLHRYRHRHVRRGVSDCHSGQLLWRRRNGMVLEEHDPAALIQACRGYFANYYRPDFGCRDWIWLVEKENHTDALMLA